jgi:hypothetical protein
MHHILPATQLVTTTVSNTALVLWRATGWFSICISTDSCKQTWAKTTTMSGGPQTPPSDVAGSDEERKEAVAERNKITNA